MAEVKRAVVLLSGHGSNLQALLDAAADAAFGVAVVLVASDRPDAGGLERARRAGVPTAVVRLADHPDRAAFDEALKAVVAAARPDVVCLAGFMRILGKEFVHAFPDRILNTHPSLLPAFPGAHAVRDALAYGVRVTGCTVHLVDEQVDHGPVLFQAPVAVEQGDDEASLHERIKHQEHRLLPAAVRLVANGLVQLDGRRARILDAPASEVGHRRAPPGPTSTGGSSAQAPEAVSEVGRSRALAGLRSAAGAAGDEGATREASAPSGAGPPSVSVKPRQRRGATREASAPSGAGPPSVSVKQASAPSGAGPPKRFNRAAP